MVKRKGLPVFQQMGKGIFRPYVSEKAKANIVDLLADEFFQIFNSTQITVMVGETGSGKTTQYV